MQCILFQDRKNNDHESVDKQPVTKCTISGTTINEPKPKPKLGQYCNIL